MRAMLSVLISLLIATPTLAQTVSDGSDAEISADELQSLYNVLPDFLKDPESARLTKLHKDRDNPDYVCGFINAKNAMGGYTGTQPFRFGLKNEMFITGMNSPC